MSPDDSIQATRQQIDILTDTALASFTAREMVEKLAQARERGRSSWWDPNQCTVENLEQLVHDQLSGPGEPDWLDVVNLAAMVHWRRRTDTPNAPTGYVQAKSRGEIEGR